MFLCVDLYDELTIRARLRIASAADKPRIRSNSNSRDKRNKHHNQEPLELANPNSNPRERERLKSRWGSIFVRELRRPVTRNDDDSLPNPMEILQPPPPPLSTVQANYNGPTTSREAEATRDAALEMATARKSQQASMRLERGRGDKKHSRKIFILHAISGHADDRSAPSLGATSDDDSIVLLPPLQPPLASR